MTREKVQTVRLVGSDDALDTGVEGKTWSHNNLALRLERMTVDYLGSIAALINERLAANVPAYVAHVEMPGFDTPTLEVLRIRDSGISYTLQLTVDTASGQGTLSISHWDRLMRLRRRVETLPLYKIWPESTADFVLDFITCEREGK